MYPKSTTGDRWAKIAGQVGKSKEECMQRYKHVADLVRKKKEHIEEPEPIDESSESQNVEPETPKDSITPTTSVEEQEERPSGDSSRVSRQSSSSSSVGSGTGSDNEWCILDSQKN